MAVATLAWTFRGTEPQRVAALLARVGGGGVLIIVPQCLALLVESLGWRMAFAGMGRRLPLFGLFRAGQYQGKGSPTGGETKAYPLAHEEKWQRKGDGRIENPHCVHGNEPCSEVGEDRANRDGKNGGEAKAEGGCAIPEVEEVQQAGQDVAGDENK